MRGSKFNNKRNVKRNDMEKKLGDIARNCRMICTFVAGME